MFAPPVWANDFRNATFGFAGLPWTVPAPLIDKTVSVFARGEPLFGTGASGIFSAPLPIKNRLVPSDTASIRWENMKSLIDYGLSSCTIQLLAQRREGEPEKISGTFHSLDQSWLQVTANQPLPLFRTVSLEHANALFLGEVLACELIAQDTWKVSVQVEQRLNGLTSLLLLREQLLSLEPARAGLPSQRPPVSERSISSGVLR